MHCQCNKCSDLKGGCVHSFEDDCQQNFSDDQCCCFACSFKRRKVKGKFGVAYTMETLDNKYGGPLGWQVEFEDTPSIIGYNCKKMINWIKCPPLGECCNLETNFSCRPEVDGRVLKDTIQTCCNTESAESFHVIKKAKPNCCPKPNHCECCDEKQLMKYCDRNTTLLKCRCFNVKGTEGYRFHASQKTNPCFCKNFKPFPKLASNHLLSNKPQWYCEDKREAENVCLCINEKVCSYCRKPIEKYYASKKCSCHDNLDYIPNRDTTSLMSDDVAKNSLTVIKSNNKTLKTTRKKELVDKLASNNNKTVNNTGKKNVKRQTMKKGGYAKEETKMQSKIEENKSSSKNEYPEKVIKSTNYDADHPSLLEKIKKAHHKQLDEIHHKLD